MDGFVIFWAVVALIVFWGVGAHNRLVRVRSQAHKAFATVNEHFQAYVSLVRSNGSVMHDTGLAELALPPTDTLTQAWLGVDGAVTQFDASLRVLSLRPLDAAAMSAMQTAYVTLRSAWDRLQNEPPDLAGHRVPDSLQQDWGQIAIQVMPAAIEFNRLVEAYNDAVGQFPANILARLMGYKPARSV
jgi:LemA protein